MRCLRHFAGVVISILPLFYQDKCLIVWLGFSPLYFIAFFVALMSTVCLANVQGFWILLWILVNLTEISFHLRNYENPDKTMTSDLSTNYDAETNKLDVERINGSW